MVTDSMARRNGLMATATGRCEMSRVSAIFGTVVVYGREAVWGFFKLPF
jgi:hypothetical protein